MLASAPGGARRPASGGRSPGPAFAAAPGPLVVLRADARGAESPFPAETEAEAAGPPLLPGRVALSCGCTSSLWTRSSEIGPRAPPREQVSNGPAAPRGGGGPFRNYRSPGGVAGGAEDPWQRMEDNVRSAQEREQIPRRPREPTRRKVGRRGERRELLASFCACVLSTHGVGAPVPVQLAVFTPQCFKITAC